MPGMAALCARQGYKECPDNELHLFFAAGIAPGMEKAGLMEAGFCRQTGDT
jgi:hypothetical protein